MADQPDVHESTGGADGAPRSLFKLARSLVVLFVVVLVVWGATALLAQLPSDTSNASLAIRAALGLGTGLVLIVVVRRMLRALVAPPPAAPPQVDARSSEVIYTCPVCGTRVRLEVAVTAKAPRHCGEEMEATLG